MLNKLLSLFKTSHTDPREAYLNDAASVYDLERRMRQIDRGEAPFQKMHNLKDIYP